MSAAYSMPSAAKARSIKADRAMGLYHTKDTLDEAIYCAHHLRSDEVAFTLFRSAGAFCAYSLREMMIEVTRWREMGLKCLPCNLRERDLGGKTVWSIVIQPKEMKDGDYSSAWCPLSMALGTLVSGFTYICKDKGLAELIIRALSSA